MKVSTNWLKQYVDITGLTPEALGDKIEMTAVEVADVTRRQTGLKKIVVGHVLSVKDHPDADHLHICQVDVGEDEPFQIVCGAPNVAADTKVIVALPGARIADNVKIKKAKMRGVVSQGMLCALQEIGFPEKVVPKEVADGIYLLPADAEVGADVYPYLGMDDAMIDLDITPNRGDMLGMRGTAYEVGAILDKPVTLPHPTLTEGTSKASDQVSAAANAKLAPTYLVRKLTNVTVKPSPVWLQNRLMNAGIRPINNVVDATNYVMLDYGQPMHAYDAAKLPSDQLTVQMAQNDQTLTTLDGEKRTLTDHDMVVASNGQPVALAGVMGGLATEVTAATKEVVLEAAVFNGHYVRKTARKHNLHTDASMRFERGINHATVAEALDAAASLIAQMADAEVLAGRVAAVNNLDTTDDNTAASTKALELLEQAAKATTVTITPDRINHVLGTQLTQNDIVKIFDRLGFTTEVTAEALVVTVPPRRWDISIPADLIEEVARIYGYNNIPTTLPAGQATPGHYTHSQKVIRASRQLLQEAGLTQAISYGLTTEEKARRFSFDPTSPVTKLAFPMTSDRTTARMNLLSGLLDDVAYNVARKVTDVALYEQGRVFFGDGQTERPTEVEHIAGAMTGLTQAKTWNQPAKPVDFYAVKGVVEHLLGGLGMLSHITYQASVDHEEMHPGRTADILYDDHVIGFVGELHPQLAAELKLKRVYVFELDLSYLMAQQPSAQIYQPVAKFPEVTRDIALLVSDEYTNQEITAAIAKKGGAYLQSVELFDVFVGKGIAAGYKSLAYTLHFLNPRATLHDEEVTAAFDKVVAYLQDNYHVKIR